MLLFFCFCLITRVLNVYLIVCLGIVLIGQYVFQSLIFFRLSVNSATVLLTCIKHAGTSVFILLNCFRHFILSANLLQTLNANRELPQTCCIGAAANTRMYLVYCQ